MEVVRLGGGPALEGGRIAGHAGKVAIMEPVDDGLFLLEAGEGELVGVGALGRGILGVVAAFDMHRTQGTRGPFLGS